MLMAKEWGCRPWELLDELDDGRGMWADRWLALHNAEHRAQTPAKTKIGTIDLATGATR
jgi:hypothetical protein